MTWRDSGRDKYCATCGRQRGIRQRRESWGIHCLVSVPRTGSPDDHPAQIANELILDVVLRRNGGTGESTHLCDECLRLGLRAIKIRVSELLLELDSGHDTDAEFAALTERLAALQYQHWNVCYEHDRMQERLRDLLQHVARSADREVVRAAEFEVSRGPAAAKGEAKAVHA